MYVCGWLYLCMHVCIVCIDVWLGAVENLHIFPFRCCLLRCDARMEYKYKIPECQALCWARLKLCLNIVFILSSCLFAFSPWQASCRALNAVPLHILLFESIHNLLNCLKLQVIFYRPVLIQLILFEYYCVAYPTHVPRKTSDMIPQYSNL